jgi:hypothetical protein
MKPRTRNIIQNILYGLGAIVVIWFIYRSVFEKDSENIIASVSLLIALASMFVTTLAYNQQLDSKLPQIIIDTDFKSRYGLVVLSIKNLGEMTAFTVRVKWDKPILNYKGENIFGQSTDSFVTTLPVLQMGQELKITIDEIGHFYSKYKDSELQYSGTVTYSLSKTTKSTIETDFTLDLSIFRKTLYHETESLKAFFELQKLPKVLDEIKEEIKKRNKE